MKTYIYPENLRATVKLWFWNVRDFIVICGGIILSVIVFVNLWNVLPIAATVCYGFLSLRVDDTAIMDYIFNAVKFFVTSQQTYLWRNQRDAGPMPHIKKLSKCQKNLAMKIILWRKFYMAKRKNNAVQSLIGFERFTRFGVKTDKAEIAFFSVEPTNISVLSAANIDTKIRHLMTLLSTVPDLEIIALDSCECFDSNKIYVKERLEIEENESVRKLLEADHSFLDEIQAEMSSARQFMFVIRFRREKDEQIFNVINRVDKAITEHGFVARRMTKSEIKRMLALYFGTSISGEEIPDIEGENYLEVSENV